MPRPTSYDRETALTSALTLFWEKGFHATSLKDLEAALEMKPGSIYAAFSSKEKLYSQAMQYYFEASLDAFRVEMAQAQSPLNGLAHHIRSYASLPLDHPHRQVCMLLKTIIDTQTTEPSLAEQARNHLDDIRTEIAMAFRDAQSNSEISAEANVNQLARRYQANVNALRVEMHQGGDGAGIYQLAEDMAAEVERLSVAP